MWVCEYWCECICDSVCVSVIVCVCVYFHSNLYCYALQQSHINILTLLNWMQELITFLLLLNRNLRTTQTPFVFTLFSTTEIGFCWLIVILLLGKHFCYAWICYWNKDSFKIWEKIKSETNQIENDNRKTYWPYLPYFPVKLAENFNPKLVLILHFFSYLLSIRRQEISVSETSSRVKPFS